MRLFFRINLVLGIFFHVLFAQTPVEYKQIEDLLIAIRTNGGDIYFAPQYFQLKEQYEAIREASPTVLSLEDRQKIQKIYRQLQEIQKDSEKIRPYLSSVLAARDAALTSGADDFARDNFLKAEEQLHELAEKLKKSRPQRYQDKIDQLERLYREAQFEALRNKLLSEVRIFLQEAKNLGAEKYAPETYHLVQQLFRQVETILKKKRFNDPTLQVKVQKLQRESQHLLFLTQIASKIYRNTSAFEKYQLRLEQTINQLCEVLDYFPDYSNGLPAVLNDITTSVESLKTSLEKERQRNRVLEDSLARLNKQLLLLQEKLGEHQRLLSRINELKKRMLEWGVVTTQKDNRIELTLNGLNFVPGGISLPQKEQQIIERMAREIQKLPYQHIEIRIIQAAPGNRQYNQTLANQRARSVALLFQTTAYIPDDKISSDGAILENSASTSEAILQVAITFQQED